jgi:hypothetical protein
MGKFRELKALNVSVCGNFLFLAYEDGLLIKLTTQRGIFNSAFKF